MRHVIHDYHRWRAAVRVNGYRPAVEELTLVGMGAVARTAIARARDEHDQVRGELWLSSEDTVHSWLEPRPLVYSEAARHKALEKGID